MNKVNKSYWFAALLAGSAGCASPPAKTGGPSLNCRGADFNGPQLNGTELVREVAPCPKVQGVHLGRVSLPSGVALPDGTLLKDVKVDGSALRSASGASLSGATMMGLAQGFTLRLRIDEVVPAQGPDNADVSLYGLSYQWGTGPDPSDKRFDAVSDWAPLCPDGKRAIALAGRWDDAERGRARKMSSDATELTLACEGSAMAKCVVTRGYKPWKSAVLDELHQACVRATRADYCGDGMSLTTEGQPLNLYDALGVQKDTEEWSFEAEWTAEGARCITDPRLPIVPDHPGLSVRDYIAHMCKDRLARPGQKCRSAAGTGEAVIWSEHPPVGAR